MPSRCHTLPALFCAGLLALIQFLPARADSPARVLAYQLTPGKTCRYKLTANLKGTVPILGTPTPIDNGVIRLVYAATPKTLLADGSADVDMKVESVDVEIGGVPLPIALEDVEKVLDQTVTFASTGEVKKIAGGGPLPFGVSIPGVDPKRLYSLIFPVVFQTRAVKPGDSWPYRSELLGGQTAKPAFTATILPPEGPAEDSPITRIRSQFALNVDQSLDADRKPVSAGEAVHRTIKGRIEGSGILNFDRVAGHFTSGKMDLKANITDDLVGKPQTPDEPKQIPSKVDAVVTVELQPDAPANPDKTKQADSQEKP